jgi:hypothetical protein
MISPSQTQPSFSVLGQFFLMCMLIDLDYFSPSSTFEKLSLSLSTLITSKFACAVPYALELSSSLALTLSSAEPN